MRKDYQSDIAADGAIPAVPLWGKDNDPHQWWMINDYEVLCAAFRHEVELFLKTFVPYLSKEGKGFQPTTPRKALILPAVAEPIRKSKSVKNVTFPEVPPISSVTSSTRLGAMITGASAGLKNSSVAQYPPRKSWNVSEDESDNPFIKTDSSEEPKPSQDVRRPGGPPSSSGSSSDSDEEGDPPKLPPRSSKRLPAIPIKPKDELENKSYHFDMKLRPEAVPTWDGNEDMLARWVDKVGQLADTSPDIFKELGKIVPRRLTNSAETWYYSIPPRDCLPMELDWGTLKTAIANYWMNHSWLEDQKFRANNTRYRETGHTHETPSEYVIQKMDLI